MSEFEAYSRELLLSSKTFLLEAKAEGLDSFNQQKLLRASLTHAFFFLEAELNYLSGHFKDNRDFDLSERSILSEKEVSLHRGEFKLTRKDKYYRLEERVDFLIVRFSGSRDALNEAWRSELSSAISLRNKLVHPKEIHQLREADVQTAVSSVIFCLSALYLAIFRKDFPLKSLGLDTGPTAIVESG
ncbi:hypothetical protein [Mameliella alba]|uniref:hypothetical protein n=1 Tax=Mameliella alba TaxID=561184 RepID=UPI000B52F0BE|nr:hypothetical protein [Mameliella alba]OWV61926.1 hypothetical protein CDZ98_05425 [Mameliella alba]